MSDPTLAPFFNPQGVAVIGATREPTKLGYLLSRNLVHIGYGGAAHFVNPKGGTLFGRPIHASILEVPDPVDLAVLLVPPQSVPETLRQCGQRGINAAIIASGGFRETGGTGAVLEQECLQVAREFGMRLLGPNCIGLLNTHLPLDTTFLQPPPPPQGEVAFVSHSGAICAAVTDWVRGQGFGLSHLISLGNSADITESDMLAPMAEDPHTGVITLYLETVNQGERFVQEARAAALKKPVIALKVGRFDAGKRAAASHTGALAGAETAYDAAFSRAGVLRANKTEEMFQWARVLAWCPLPEGKRVAVLTNAGGPGVTAADALEQNGLELTALSPHTTDALKTFLPAAASLINPVDMLASASPSDYAESLRIMLADPGVDMVMVVMPPPPAFTAGGTVKMLIPVIQVQDKPVVVVLMGERLIQEGVALCRAARIPDYRFPEEAANALGALYQRTLALSRLAQPEAPVTGVNLSAANARIVAAKPGDWMLPEQTQGLLADYGIRTVPLRLATHADEAVSIAGELGYPLVMKVASADIPHKSDIGGVLLDLRDEASVMRGYKSILQRARAALPDARIDGVHLQRMLGEGQEVILGVVRDPQFGPLVMFGSGGVEVEGLHDVAFALAPLSEMDARDMLQATWAGRKLAGFRHLVPADRAAVLETLIRLAKLAHDHPQIAEIEINPLRVMPEGQGAFAIDARARLGSSPA